MNTKLKTFLSICLSKLITVICLKDFDVTNQSTENNQPGGIIIRPFEQNIFMFNLITEFILSLTIYLCLSAYNSNIREILLGNQKMLLTRDKANKNVISFMLRIIGKIFNFLIKLSFLLLLIDTAFIFVASVIQVSTSETSKPIISMESKIDAVSNINLSEPPRNLAALTTQSCKIISSLTSWLSFRLSLSPDESLALVGSFMSGFIVMDISDISKPSFAFGLVPNGLIINFGEVTQDNSLLFMTDNGKTSIYNITNRANPQLISTLSKGTNNIKIGKLRPFVYVAGLGDHACVFDISNIRSPVFLSCFTSNSATVENVELSPDEKTAFICGSSGMVHIVNVSNPSSPVQLSTFTVNSPKRTALINDSYLLVADSNKGLIVLDVRNRSNPTSLYNDNLGISEYDIAVDFTIDGNYAYFLVGGLNVIRVYDLTMMNQISLMTQIYTPTKCYDIKLSRDKVHFFIVCGSSGLVVYELFQLRYNLDKIFAMPSILSTTFTNDWGKGILLTKDEKYLVYANDQTSYRVYDITTNPPTLRVTGAFLTPNARGMAITPDEKYIFMGSYNRGVYVFNFANRPSMSLVTIISYSGDQGVDIVSLSADGRILYFSGGGIIRIYNVTNPAAPVVLSTLAVSGSFSYSLLSPDQNNLFVSAGTRNYVINVSNVRAPVVQSTVPLIDRITAINKNGMLALAVGSALFGIVDISNRSNPILVSKLSFSGPNDAQFSVDEKKALIADQNGGIKILDITDIYNPTLIMVAKFGNVAYLKVSKDGNKIYTAGYDRNFRVGTLNIPPPIGIMIPQNLLLGETYDGIIKVLAITGDKVTYTPCSFSYKLNRLSIYSLDSSAAETYAGLPTWMSIESKNGIYSFTPNSADQIGIYYLYIVVAKPIPTNVFSSFLGSNSAECLVNLIASSYIDISYYLTENYDPTASLILSSGSVCANQETNIKSALNNYYYETLTKISVTSSLNSSFQNSNKLSFQTLSQKPITVTVKLATDFAQFVDIPYTAQTLIRDSGKTIILTGTKQEVNSTLLELRVNSLQPGVDYNGTMIIQDGINPDLNLKIERISRFLVQNKPPELRYIPFTDNISISNIKVWTYAIPVDLFKDGNEIQQAITYDLFYKLSNGTFISIPTFISFDVNRNIISCQPTLSILTKDPVTSIYEGNHRLVIQATNIGGSKATYEFTLKILNGPPRVRIPIQDQVDKVKLTTGDPFTIILFQESFEDPDNDPITLRLSKGPSWVSIISYSISGIPPEGFSIEADIIIEISDGFQSIQQPIRIKAFPSAFFIFRNVASIFTALLTVLGLYVYFNKFYNILMKKNYRIQKVFYFPPFKQIGPTDIYSFAVLESFPNIADRVLNRMPHYLAYEIGKEKIKLKDMVEYFIGEDNMPTNTEVFSSVVSKIYQNKEVINEKEKLRKITTMNYLKSIDTSTTGFEELVRELIFHKFIEHRISSNPRLENIFHKIKIDWHEFCTVKDHDTILTQFDVNRTKLKHSVALFDEKMQIFNDQNQMNLLSLAIHAHAQIQCSVQINMWEIKIESFHEIKYANAIEKFFKSNLKKIEIDQTLGHGITYKRLQNKITFSGTTNPTISGERTCIQINTIDGRNLKEIIVQGTFQSFKKDKDDESKSEEKAFLKKYTTDLEKDKAIDKTFDKNIDKTIDSDKAKLISNAFTMLAFSEENRSEV